MEEEGKQIEETQETQQEQKQEGRERKYEVRIIRQISCLPTVFMLKTKWGQVIKISLQSEYTLDCSKYVSRSGLTFEGCYKFNNNILQETRGIYYVPLNAEYSLVSGRKLSRGLEEMKQKILDILQALKLSKEKLLIKYDNYVIELYEKYRKASLFEFSKIAEQGHLEIFEVPSPKTTVNLKFETTKNINIYNHILESNGDIKVYHLYVSAGMAYLIYVPEYVFITLKSPDHEERILDLYSGQYYLISHPIPRSNKID